MRMYVCAISVLLAALSCGDEQAEKILDPACLTASDNRTLIEPRLDPQPSAPPATEHAPVGGFCDGTSEATLVVTTRQVTGGIAPYTVGYDHGLPFMVIDGRCHYFALHEPMKGLVEGELSALEVEQITRDLSLELLEDFPSSRDACTDHWDEMLVATRKQSLRCACAQCVTPSGTDTLTNARAWLERLAGEGTPTTGRVRALAVPREPVDLGTPGGLQEVLEWPLSEPMQRIRGLVAEAWTQSGAVFDGSAAAELRRIRAQSSRRLLAPDLPALTSFVTSCGVTHQLELRDLLPETAERDLDAFLASAWSRPQIVSCRDWNTDAPRTDCPPAR